MPHLSISADKPDDDTSAEAQYTSTARYLSNPLPSSASHSRPPPQHPSGFTPPRWTQMQHSASTLRSRILSLHPLVRSTHDKALSLLTPLTPLQRGLLTLAALILLTSALVLVLFHATLLAHLRPLAISFRTSSYLWLLPFLLILLVSFPPLIGYSTLFTLCGFVFGVARGFALVAPATVLGSTLSFLVCRRQLRDFSQRLVRRDDRFAALAAVLAKDGLPLLICIRLCPLPYSLSNAAISAVPSVRAWHFAVATGAATPRLLVGLFIGARLGELADDEGGKMGWGTRVVSWISVLVGMGIGIGTGWWMYARVKRRAAELQNEGGGVDTRDDEEGGRRRAYEDWVDDEEEEERRDDGISLHTAAGEEEDEEETGDKTRTRSALDDVFDAGDGESDDEHARYTDEDHEADNARHDRSP